MSAQWMTLPLELSMGLPFSARHAPRVCSENWTKEASFCLYMVGVRVRVRVRVRVKG